MSTPPKPAASLSSSAGIGITITAPTITTAVPVPGTREFADCEALRAECARMQGDFRFGAPVVDCFDAIDLARDALRRVAVPSDDFEAIRNRFRGLVEYIMSLDAAGRAALRRDLNAPRRTALAIVAGTLADTIAPASPITLAPRSE